MWVFGCVGVGVWGCGGVGVWGCGGVGALGVWVCGFEVDTMDSQHADWQVGC